MHAEIVNQRSVFTLYTSSINAKTHDDSSIQILLIMASRPGFLGHFIAHGIIILLLILGYIYIYIYI
jgi:hypothetical protein